MELLNFFRSGTSHRLRIALNLKELSYEYIPVDLTTDENFDETYTAINPQGFVPTLRVGDLTLIQSPAIIEWLDEKFPTPPLLPIEVTAKARVRALANIVGCDIHPLNNKRVLVYLRTHLGMQPEAINKWCEEWITSGFKALEKLLAEDTSRTDYSYGNSPTMADVYLIPQIESARRFGVDMSAFPIISSIDDACGKLDAFIKAAPANQPDHR